MQRASCKEARFTCSTTMNKYHSKLYNDILLCYPNSSHCLVELSKTMLSRISNNVITLSGVTCHNGIEYKTIQYGSNIQCVVKERKALLNGISDIINLSKVKNNFMVVVAKCDECLKHFPHIHIIKMGELYQHTPMLNVSSGFVLLCVASAKNVKTDETPKNGITMILKF